MYSIDDLVVMIKDGNSKELALAELSKMYSKERVQMIEKAIFTGLRRDLVVTSLNPIVPDKLVKEIIKRGV